ncbi:hypothetical protein B296_00041378 [Ensete ventricosum]|uniref:Uncharacterized protein n=1 Tax=Ensete ventricosum TaxID=4639 RepID=A0A426Z9G1_ENSVE|nr:hypothetical protein B296_00041378 [Ensete ventricosum]
MVTCQRLSARVIGALTTWVEELSSVLWALQTTPKTPTGESPYSLAYGTEVVLSPKMLFSTLRIDHFTLEVSEVGLDLLEERRAEAHLKTLHYQRVVAQLYNRKVRPRPIGMGDLVLKKVGVSDLGHSHGKLASR